MSKPKILLISAYHAQSHDYWAQSLCRLESFEWTLLTLEPRYYAWRIRGNAMSLAVKYEQALMASYDLLLVTSMTDLTALRGLYPHLATLPSIVYSHENQFAYPQNPHLSEGSKQQTQSNQTAAQITSIYNVMAADQVLFNSEYNQRTFLQGARKLLKKLPDYCIDIDKLEDKMSVMAIAVAAGHSNLPVQEIKPQQCLHLLWVARWEFDKGIEELYQTLKQLRAQFVDFRLTLLGQSFRTVPTTMQNILTEFADCIAFAGFAETKQIYDEHLKKADIVLSTSKHEFFGIAIMESLLAGCWPLLPNSQVYPEIYAEKHLYNSIDELLEKIKLIYLNGLLDRPELHIDIDESSSLQKYDDFFHQALMKKIEHIE